MSKYASPLRNVPYEEPARIGGGISEPDFVWGYPRALAPPMPARPAPALRLITNAPALRSISISRFFLVLIADRRHFRRVVIRSWAYPSHIIGAPSWLAVDAPVPPSDAWKILPRSHPAAAGRRTGTKCPIQFREPAMQRPTVWRHTTLYRAVRHAFGDRSCERHRR